MARRVRVASRALKRGRGLRSSAARIETQAPDSASELEQSQADEPQAETVPEPRPSDEAASDEETPVSSERVGYSRPPAPAFDFAAKASLEELAAMTAPAAEDDEPAYEEQLDALDDAVPQRETAPAIPTAFKSDSESYHPVDDELLSTTLESNRDIELEDGPLDEGADDEEAVFLVEPPDARDEAGSLMPVVDEHAPESVAPASVTPEQRQRRTRLRRGVGIAVAAVALLTVGLATKAAVTSAPAYAERHAATAAAALADDAPVRAKAPIAQAESVDAPAVEQTEESPADADAVDGDYETIRKQTLQLLNERKFDEAVVSAQKLIALEPTTALGYRCLGSAYQDLGKMKEARQAYSDCVRVAKKGEVRECSALGGTAK